jgi:hypothetical protein
MTSNKRRKVDNTVNVEVDKAVEEIKTFDYTNFNLEKAGTFLKNLASIVVNIKESLVFQSTEISNISRKCEGLERENDKLNRKLKECEDRSSTLEKRLSQLEFENDVPIREKNKNNIVLAGLPVDLPDPENMLIKISKKINANFNKDELIGIDQVKQYKDKKESSLYVVKFKSAEQKTEFMNKKKHFKHLLKKDLGLKQDGEDQVFFRHHLTNLQKSLYFRQKK